MASYCTTYKTSIKQSIWINKKRSQIKKVGNESYNLIYIAWKFMIVFYTKMPLILYSFPEIKKTCVCDKSLKII